MENVANKLNEGRLIDALIDCTTVVSLVSVTVYTAWVLNAGTALSSLPIA
jgi:hypothetical protein